MRLGIGLIGTAINLVEPNQRQEQIDTTPAQVEEVLSPITEMTTITPSSTRPEIVVPGEIKREVVVPKTKQEVKVPEVKKQNCHPSYSGCLNSNASDYDCEGGRVMVRITPDLYKYSALMCLNLTEITMAGDVNN